MPSPLIVVAEDEEHLAPATSSTSTTASSPTPVDSVLRVVDLIKRHGHTTPHAHNEATSDWAIRA